MLQVITLTTATNSQYMFSFQIRAEKIVKTEKGHQAEIETAKEVARENVVVAAVVVVNVDDVQERKRIKKRKEGNYVFYSCAEVPAGILIEIAILYFSL
jgi:hypothetical protein